MGKDSPFHGLWGSIGSAGSSPAATATAVCGIGDLGAGQGNQHVWCLKGWDFGDLAIWVSMVRVELWPALRFDHGSSSFHFGGSPLESCAELEMISVHPCRWGLICIHLYFVMQFCFRSSDLFLFSSYSLLSLSFAENNLEESETVNVVIELFVVLPVGLNFFINHRCTFT